MNSIDEAFTDYIAIAHYARWNEKEGRRETWDETVQRVVDYLRSKYPRRLPADFWPDLYARIHDKQVMPSMRLVATAGEAADRDNTCIYNCAYTPIDRPSAFEEIMHNLMCGAGQGYSVERHYVDQLPPVPEHLTDCDTCIIVPDSRTGWHRSFGQLLGLLWGGSIPKWDMSKVREKGAPLKTQGGTASGPEPLEDLFAFTVATFKHATGRKLTPLQVHDIACKIAMCVVVGGTRRSAMIALFDQNDRDMLECKTGDWYNDPLRKQRALSNNSAVFNSKPSLSEFMDLWTTLYRSGSGEPGFFNRNAANNKHTIQSGLRSERSDWGTNPCCEIILRPRQFCNLTEVVCRVDDQLEDIKSKIETATILGTMQAGLTNFKYLSRAWHNNAEEEALLGVSLTGIFDCDAIRMAEPSDLEELREYAREVNKIYSRKLGVPPSAAITCIKPSGTVSKLVNSSAGIHPRFSDFYIQRVRCADHNPVAKFLVHHGVPYTMEGSNYVFSFPLQNPNVHAPTAQHLPPIAALELWKRFDQHWCDHKPSCTVYFNDDNFLQVGAWVYENFDDLSGLSFFPYFDSVVPNQPMEPISFETYENLVAIFPAIPWGEFFSDNWELGIDTTTAAQELACTGGACDITND